MTPAVLAGMIRGIPHEELGRLVADLPDEDLAVIARSVLELFMREGRGAPKRTATRRPTAKLRSEIAKSTRGAGRAEANGHAPPDGPTVASVYKAIVGADEAIRPRDIVKATKLEPTQVRYALKTLKDSGRVFSAGSTQSTCYALTQELADEALEEAASP